MKSTQKKILLLVVAVSFFSCISNVDKKNTDDSNYSEFLEYELLFAELKVHLAEENGKLWNHQLYGPILIVDEKNQLIIANEADENQVLTKNGKVFTGPLPKEMPVAETTINWNGKLWAMVPLPLPHDYNEQLSIFTHELFHRIQSEIGLSIQQQNKCEHLDDLDGRIYLKLELEALKMALRSNDKDVQAKHIQNALLFRAYRHQIYPNAQESENALELSEGIAEYTGTILSKWDDEGLRSHYIQAIDTLYENKTFVRSFAYRTIPIYGYYINKNNTNWNKEITNTTDLTDYISDQFNVQIPDNLMETIEKIKSEYYYQDIYDFEIEREQKQKELLANLEIKFQSNPILIIPLINMNISFSPGDLIPFKDIGTVYQKIRLTDKWGSLKTEKDVLLDKMWKSVIVSEPKEISDTLIRGDGWELELNTNWKLEKIGDNYTLKLD